MNANTTQSKVKKKTSSFSRKQVAKQHSQKNEEKISPSRAIISVRPDKGQSLKEATKRLKESGRPQRVLQVPQKDMDKAVAAMKKAGITGTVKNLKGSKRKYVGTTAVKLNLSKSSK